MGCSRQEYWRLPCPSPGQLPNLGIKPGFPALQADSLSLSHQGKPSPCLNLTNYPWRASSSLLYQWGNCSTESWRNPPSVATIWVQCVESQHWDHRAKTLLHRVSSFWRVRGLSFQQTQATLTHDPEPPWTHLHCCQSNIMAQSYSQIIRPEGKHERETQVFNAEEEDHLVKTQPASFLGMRTRMAAVLLKQYILQTTVLCQAEKIHDHSPQFCYTPCGCPEHPGHLGKVLYHPAHTNRALLVRLEVESPPANAGDARDMGSIPRSGRAPGRGHGNPLQYSRLENPMHRGAWQATVHGAAIVGHYWSDLACTILTSF